MTVAFADTFYFIALLNAKDAAHQKAVEFSRSRGTALLTTAWVLTELADAMADVRHRNAFGKLLAGLRADPDTTVVPPSAELFEQGVDRYNSRTDKEWSLTDCISFVVMEQSGIKEALTGDHHFEQAGFRALLA
jgi:predicted nucleic acid-binding protein